MRISFHAGLAIVLSAAMVCVPFVTAPASAASAPLGVVLQAERATVGADATLGGATIYDGDRLGTSQNGTLRARLGGSQMYLRASSSARVHTLSNGFSAELNGGTVVVSSPEGQSFQLVADGAMIRPAGSQATTAEVTWVTPTQLLLTANRGSLQISMEDEVKTIDAGSSYRMEVEAADPAAEPMPQHGPYHTASNHFILIAIAAISAATAIGVWRALVSPSAP